jgi:hypothetical protein
MEIEPMYIEFNTAKRLKEKGFDEAVRLCYSDDDDNLLPFDAGNKLHINSKHPYYSAPEQWQVIEWLRLKHDIWIEVRRTSHFNEIRYQSYINEKYLSGDMGGYVSHTTPQEAYSAAFNHILNNKLI